MYINALRKVRMLAASVLYVWLAHMLLSCSAIGSTSMVATVEERPSAAVATLIQAPSGDQDPIAMTTFQSQSRWRARDGSNHLTGSKHGTLLIDVAEIVRDSPEPMRDFR